MVQTTSSNSSLEEVKKKLQVLKPTLKKKFKVETIDIFGSYPRGDNTRKSDLDILVTYTEPISLLLIYDLKQYLKNKLGLQVDIVSKNFLNKHIREQVLKEAIKV